MLYPYESRSREVKDISGVWRFKLDRDGVGMKERWYEKKLEGSIPMPVPASYNDITQEADVRDYVGVVRKDCNHSPELERQADCAPIWQRDSFWQGVAEWRFPDGT